MKNLHLQKSDWVWLIVIVVSDIVAYLLKDSEHYLIAALIIVGALNFVYGLEIYPYRFDGWIGMNGIPVWIPEDFGADKRKPKWFTTIFVVVGIITFLAGLVTMIFSNFQLRGLM